MTPSPKVSNAASITVAMSSRIVRDEPDTSVPGARPGGVERATGRPDMLVPGKIGGAGPFSRQRTWPHPLLSSTVGPSGDPVVSRGKVATAVGNPQAGLPSL